MKNSPTNHSLEGVSFSSHLTLRHRKGRRGLFLSANFVLALMAGCAGGAIPDFLGGAKRDNLFAEGDVTRYNLGMLCATPTGEVYGETTHRQERIAIVKYDAKGERLWTTPLRALDGVSSSHFSDCQSGGVTVITHTAGNNCSGSFPKALLASAARLSESGQILWEARIEVPNASRVILRAISTDGRGNTYIGGHYDTCGSGDNERPLLVRINPQGVPEFRSVQIPAIAEIGYLDVTGSNIRIAGKAKPGYYVAVLNGNGVPLWNLRDESFPLSVALEGMTDSGGGGLLVCGHEYLKEKMQVANLDAKGKVRWIRDIDGLSTSLFNPCLLQLKGTKDSFLVGSSKASSKFVLRRVSAAGLSQDSIEVEDPGDLIRGMDFSTTPLAFFVGGTPSQKKILMRPYILKFSLDKPLRSS